MPPKKVKTVTSNLNSPSKELKKKVVRAGKAKPNRSSLTKCSSPLRKTNTGTSYGSSPNTGGRKSKILDYFQKVALANEVLELALAKKNPVHDSNTEVVTILSDDSAPNEMSNKLYNKDTAEASCVDTSKKKGKKAKQPNECEVPKVAMKRGRPKKAVPLPCASHEDTQCQQNLDEDDSQDIFDIVSTPKTNVDEEPSDTPKIVKKRGKPKKVVAISSDSLIDDNTSMEITEVFTASKTTSTISTDEGENVTTPFKGVYKESAPKKQTIPVIKSTRMGTRKRKADSTVENIEVTNAKQSDCDKLLIDKNSVTESKLPSDNDLLAESNPVPKPATSRKRTVRGKQITEDNTPGTTSPSILSTQPIDIGITSPSSASKKSSIQTEAFTEPPDSKALPTDVKSKRNVLQPKKSKTDKVGSTASKRPVKSLSLRKKPSIVTVKIGLNKVKSIIDPSSSQLVKETIASVEPIIEKPCLVVVESTKLPTVKLSPIQNQGSKLIAANRIASTDSRESAASNYSNLSWTKDISSSSATTFMSVSSNDIVRFNKKLPVVKLTNIDSKVNKINEELPKSNINNDICDSDSDESTSSSSSSSTNSSSESVSVSLSSSLGRKSLNLSVSTLSRSQNIEENNVENKLNSKDASEKLLSSINKLNTSLLNNVRQMNKKNCKQWRTVLGDLRKFKYKVLEYLDSEFSVIRHCQRLRNILEPPVEEERNRIDVPDGLTENVISENHPQDNINEVENDNAISNEAVDFVKSVTTTTNQITPRRHSNISEVSSISINQYNTRDSFDREEPPQDMDDCFDTNNDMPTDVQDDDDALSLYAESITGIESSRMNTSIISNPIQPEPFRNQFEEYVPKPLKEDQAPPPDKYIYNPSKIPDANNVNKTQKSVCEKQTADSTSIYKESNSTGGDSENYQDWQEKQDLELPQVYNRFDPSENTVKLMSSIYQVQRREKSILFSGYCFFNLIDSCKRSFPDQQCRFSHVKPPVMQIKSKVAKVSNETFIKEYMLLRNWPQIRRRYGMCFVEECVTRRLTRILVEMAFDFVIRANKSQEDTELRNIAVEITLLYLNELPSLLEVEDLLKLNVHNKVMLCDVFMAIMSMTQNFSRFKSVFLSMTYFNVENDRAFSLSVAENILERVCILPFEESVSKAMIQIMRLTNPAIFQNSMIVHLEKRISCQKEVYDEYMMLKNQSQLASFLKMSLVGEEPEKGTTRRPEGERAPVALSPDTTNLDNVNKLAEEIMKLVETPKKQPLITRTIGNPTTQQLPQNRYFDNPGTSSENTSKNDQKYNYFNIPSTSNENSSESNQKYNYFNNPSTSNEDTASNIPYYNKFKIHGTAHDVISKSSPKYNYFNHPRTSNEDNPKNKPQYKSWNNRKICGIVGTSKRDSNIQIAETRPVMGPPVMMPPKRPFNQRLVTFRGSPTNHAPRHSSPD